MSGDVQRETGHGALLPLEAKVGALLFSCREDGWDSYGAGALTHAAVVSTARTLANSLFPTVNGGLSLEWDSTDHGPAGRSGLYIEFGDDGSLIAFHASDGTTEVEWEASQSGRQLQEPRS